MPCNMTPDEVKHYIKTNGFLREIYGKNWREWPINFEPSPYDMTPEEEAHYSLTTDKTIDWRSWPVGPFAESPPYRVCDCPDAVTLSESDGEHIASEKWCPKHGYQTSCYLCNHSHTTERCVKHRT